jgi:leader peptidase (prepilin peptidase)/N-methyltransferase
MNLLSLATESQIIFLSGAGLLGLLIGSFLNVVITRVPCRMDSSTENEPSLFRTLLFPGSHCPKCQTPIAWFHNIPLFSYLWLKGQCYNCHQKISIQYPLVELLTVVLSVAVAMRFGLTWVTLCGLLLTWSLVALAFIDGEHTILPDSITLPTLWLGLFINAFDIFATPTNAIIGAISGYLSLFAVFWGYKWITGKDGLGFGDFKLLAMLGAWLGWQSLPIIILLSSLLGSIVGIGLIVFRAQDKNIPIPYGPFLAIAGFLALLWDSEFNLFYFKLFVL